MKTTFIVALTMVMQLTTQAQGKYGAGQDSVSCVENLSLYQEYRKQKDYASARGPWTKAITICPESSKNLYIYGATMFKTYIKEESDKVKKAELIDSLFWIYDQRIQRFGEQEEVWGRWGSDLLRYRRSEAEAAEKMLKASFDGLGNESKAGVLAFYYNAVYSLQKEGLRTTNDLISLYPKLMAVVEYQEAKGKGKNYLRAKESIDEIFQKVADCESLIPFYTEEWAKQGDDIKLLKDITSVLDKKKCTDDPLFYKAATKLAALEPSAKAYYSLGIVASRQENWTDAAANFDQAATQSDADPSTKENALVNSSKANLKMGHYATAASKARAAAAVNPKNGEVHLLIADAYAYSAGSCGDNECTEKSAYWVAYDEVLKAIAKDPSLKDMANKKAASYKSRFPDKEKCFFHSIAEGSDYTVGCWINQSTKVRFR